ncbi:hypothetical protein NQ318_016327 [Aromia moschata]|uniref:DUF4802 domain-containing protein n=1 Tax=Aromia moschata TaxID=1265417 RepID=A0AAV8Z388_9CUCU|nr:hypothetical protein NQ318_016327 [Aromia moschata]
MSVLVWTSSERIRQKFKNQANLIQLSNDMSLMAAMGTLLRSLRQSQQLPDVFLAAHTNGTLRAHTQHILTQHILTLRAHESKFGYVVSDGFKCLGFFIQNKPRKSSLDQPGHKSTSSYQDDSKCPHSSSSGTLDSFRRRRSSIDLYEEAASILGLTCAETDDCKCLECQVLLPR